jgi:hypothetical protein
MIVHLAGAASQPNGGKPPRHKKFVSRMNLGGLTFEQPFDGRVRPQGAHSALSLRGR